MELFCITGAACGTCNQCVKIKAGSHPDFFYFNDDPLKVDTAREIVKHAFTKPSEAEYKIFIIDNGDNIRPEAQNALLKIIEEPQNAYFIFLCQNSRSLLPTVLSRCQIFSLDGDEAARCDESISALSKELPSALSSELTLCEFFSRASALNRSDFSALCVLCKEELHTLLLKGFSIDTERLLKIYDCFDLLAEDFIYNPNIFALSMATCANIWEIIENR